MSDDLSVQDIFLKGWWRITAEGRLSRLRYFCLSILNILIFIAALTLEISILGLKTNTVGVLIIIVQVLSLIRFTSALTARRLHDLNLSARHLLWIIPLDYSFIFSMPSTGRIILITLSVAVFGGLIFWPGTNAANRFGPNPRQKGIQPPDQQPRSDDSASAAGYPRLPPPLPTDQIKDQTWKWVGGTVVLFAVIIIAYAISGSSAGSDESDLRISSPHEQVYVPSNGGATIDMLRNAMGQNVGSYLLQVQNFGGPQTITNIRINNRDDCALVKVEDSGSQYYPIASGKTFGETLKTGDIGNWATKCPIVKVQISTDTETSNYTPK